MFRNITSSEKFAQQEKTNQIDAFLNKNKLKGGNDTTTSKQSTPIKSRRTSLTSQSIPPATDHEATDVNKPTKVNLADVIIAAAAAKTVKLKTKGIIS